MSKFLLCIACYIYCIPINYAVAEARRCAREIVAGPFYSPTPLKRGYRVRTMYLGFPDTLVLWIGFVKNIQITPYSSGNPGHFQTELFVSTAMATKKKKVKNPLTDKRILKEIIDIFVSLTSNMRTKVQDKNFNIFIFSLFYIYMWCDVDFCWDFFGLNSFNFILM